MTGTSLGTVVVSSLGVVMGVMGVITSISIIGFSGLMTGRFGSIGIVSTSIFIGFVSSKSESSVSPGFFVRSYAS